MTDIPNSNVFLSYCSIYGRSYCVYLKEIKLSAPTGSNKFCISFGSAKSFDLLRFYPNGFFND